MPSKKKKYNARFPAGRIKKIMQSDEEIGKVAQAVPVIISRTLELFVESLLTKTLKITNSRNAKTLSPSHMKQCIMSENRFDFLRELVKNIPDISVAEEVSNDSSPEVTVDTSDTPYDLSMPSTSNCSETKNQGGAIPSNGTIVLPTRSNGVTRSCGTTIVASSLQIEPGNRRASEEKRAHLKRNCDAMSRGSNFEGVATKLIRTDSAPAGLKLPTITQQSEAATITSQDEHHQNNQPNQLLPTDLRRLRHQPKSVPGNICIEKNKNISSSQTNKSNSNCSNNSSKSQPQTPTTAIPAPIVSIDFCNKPIVKIDYSNLTLHDNAYSESPSSSSSSSSTAATPPDDQSNKKSANCIAKTKIQPAKGAAEGGPVINIDLSNIVTSGTFATSSVHPSVISSNHAGFSAQSIITPAPALKTDKNSYLELDEDYDNI